MIIWCCQPGMINIQENKKTSVFLQIVSAEWVGGGGGGRGWGGCYIFSILVYIVEYFTVVKVNTIRLKPKTSGSLRKTWKYVKSMICAIPRNRESVTFRRLLHINRFFFRENIALTNLIPYIHNNLVFLSLLICRFWLFCQFYCICASNSLKKQNFNKIKGVDVENG